MTALAVAAGILLLLFLSPAASGASAGWRLASLATPMFLQGASSGLVATPPPAAGSSPRGTFPTSVLNPAGPQLCSAETNPLGQGICSTGINTPDIRCSAVADSSQQCSAFSSPQTGGSAICSTLDPQPGTNNACSVAIPGLRPPTGPSFCSAAGSGTGFEVMCSVLGLGGGDFQICSTQMNPGGSPTPNECSATQQPGSSGFSACSVLSSDANKAACTTMGTGGARFCSALSDFAECSVQLDVSGQPMGKCTTLRGADPQTCSVAAGVTGGHCSVIGGASGDPCGFH